MNTNSEYIRELIEENKRMPEVGVVEDVTARTSSSTISNHEADVKLRSEQLTRHNVPIAVGTNGMVNVPEVGDVVIVSFFEGRDDDPFISHMLYTGQTRAPLGDEGDYRIRINDAEFEFTTNSSDEDIVSVTRQTSDGSDPDMGIELNMDTGEFKLGDGSGFGIESDGSGNFTWYANSVDMVDDGSTIDWTR